MIVLKTTPDRTESSLVPVSKALLVGENRPSFVIENMERSFAHAHRLRPRSYAAEGSEIYSYSEDFSSDHLIQRCLEMYPNQKMRVLDVGTGNGLFVKSLSEKYPYFSVIGISASDLRGGLNIPDRQYLITNAETLFEEGKVAESSQDLIVSSYTFMHLVDPMGTLERLYRLLSANGVLCIEYFSAKGLEGYVEDWIDFLHREGYLVAAEFSKKQISKGECDFLLIKKTHPTLVMPFFYTRLSEPTGELVWSYSIDHTKIPLNPKAELSKQKKQRSFDFITEEDLNSKRKLPSSWIDILVPNPWVFETKV